MDRFILFLVFENVLWRGYENEKRIVFVMAFGILNEDGTIQIQATKQVIKIIKKSSSSVLDELLIQF